MGVPADEASGLCGGLNAAVLTLGFARSLRRLQASEPAPARPGALAADPHERRAALQLIIAGKAHPADRFGQELIRRWIEFIRLPEACGRVVFIAPGRAPGPGRRRVGMTVCSPIRSVAFQLMSMASFTL